jgi:isonocardicin synthase
MLSIAKGAMAVSIVEEMFLPEQAQVARERARYEQYKISAQQVPEPLALERIKGRKIETLREPFNELPHAIYVFELEGVSYLGRKQISELKLRGELLEMNCSRLMPAMLLGVLVSTEVCQDAVTAYFHPLTPGEKLTVQAKLRRNLRSGVHFPFIFLDQEKKERCSPPAGWALDRTRAANLGIGETHLRAYTTWFLSRFNMQGKVVYDPACSTGQFLHSIKTAFPECKTVGQDLSQDMIDYAKDFVDVAICGDALDSPIDPGSCDFIFVRFLNSEVVTRSQAYMLFPRLLARLKPGGHIIVFGHTPVLLNPAYFDSLGLKCHQRLGEEESSGAVFQYFVLQK